MRSDHQRKSEVKVKANISDFFLFLRYLYWYSLVQSGTYFTQTVSGGKECSGLFTICWDYNKFIFEVAVCQIYFVLQCVQYGSSFYPNSDFRHRFWTDLHRSSRLLQPRLQKKLVCTTSCFDFPQKNFLLMRNWTDLG